MDKKECYTYYFDEDMLDDLVKLLLERNITISKTFCQFYIDLLILNPIWAKIICSGSLKELADELCIYFTTQSHITFTTIQIQSEYLENIVRDEYDVLKVHEEELKICLKPLLENILSFTLDGDDKSLTQTLFKRISLYITLRAGLGNPKNGEVLQEAMYALKSILTKADLYKFVKLKDEEKESELWRYQHIVSGIRLFNRDCGKPAAEIEDVPKLLVQAINSGQLLLQNRLLKIMEYVNLTTSAIDYVHKLCKENSSEYHLKVNLPENVTKQNLEDAIDFLILLRQHEVYVRNALDDMAKAQELVNELLTELHIAFTEIHAAVKLKVAIETQIVYPLFTQLAQAWQTITNKAIALSMYTTKYKKITKYFQSMYLDTQVLSNMIGDGEIYTDAMRLEKTMGSKIICPDSKCEILDPSHIRDFDNIPLQYLGFCAWSLVQTNGGLIPGNPNMGICKWKNKYYVFSSPKAAYSFCMDPERYVLCGYDVIRNRLALVNLLQVYSQLIFIKGKESLYEKPPQLVSTCSTQVQTEPHPIPKYIDKEYTWNVWELYRRALHLANLAQCKTHSVQTNKSHLRGECPTQTTVPKNQATQTKRDNYINTPKPMMFLFGLRGRREADQHIVNLTRPVDR